MSLKITVDELQPQHGWVFVIGLVLYIVGFALLLNDRATSAPFGIVGGLLTMASAFLL